MMKTTILFLSLAIVLSSCKKLDQVDIASNFNDSKGTSISLTDSKWFTSKSGNSTNGLGKVNLLISGSTNADKVLVETYGDGVRADFDLALDQQKNIKKDTISISFMHFSGTPSSESFQCSTKLKAIRGSDTLVVTLNSGKLRY